MKREIICKNDMPSLKKIFERTCAEHPEEHFKIVKGKLIRPCLCDHCGKELFPVLDGAFAVSIWSDYGAQPYYEWESEFLKNGVAV
jgi:hypothetical protein